MRLINVNIVRLVTEKNADGDIPAGTGAGQKKSILTWVAFFYTEDSQNFIGFQKLATINLAVEM